MPSSVLVRMVFGALVVATFAAFFVAQRLKRETPIVERVHYNDFISPKSVKGKDRVNIYFGLPKPGRVTAALVNEAGDEVRTLVDDRRLSKGRHRFVWNGRTDSGAIAPDGKYRLRVTLRDEGRSVTAPKRLRLDTRPPHPRILEVAPSTVLPGAAGELGRARIRFRGPAKWRPLIQVYRTDLARPQLMTAFEGKRGRHTAEWDGMIGGQVRPGGRRTGGRPAPDGTYAITVTTYDRAGNPGSAPRRLPPRRSEAIEGSGVSVRYLTVEGPLEPVAAGSVARFEVGPLSRRLRWSLGPTSFGQAVARGQARAGKLAIRIPRRTPTGLYYLRVQAAGHKAVQPVIVQGRRSGRVLVVLPAIAWQGGNPVDDDADGFPNTLGAGDAVRPERPFAHGRPPAGIDEKAAPLMRFLSREHVRYEITSDLALARGEGPGLGSRPGVLFAGDETWLTGRLDLALRRYVERGGRVASFGTDSFRRRVSVGSQRLSNPTPPEQVNVFGEQTAPLQIEQAPMAVNSGDELGLFRDTDGLVGLFSRFEQEQRLVAGARVLSSAGRDPDHPAFVAYRLGGGIVVRTGTPAWSAGLAGDPELTDVTRRIWSLLSR